MGLAVILFGYDLDRMIPEILMPVYYLMPSLLSMLSTMGLRPTPPG